MLDSGLRIREIRDNKKESGLFVAQILGISPQYYYDLEKGKRNLSTEIAAKLANHFSVSVDYLLGRVYENTAKNNVLQVAEESIIYDLGRPEIKALVDSLKNATTEEIEKAIKIIEALKEK